MVLLWFITIEGGEKKRRDRSGSDIVNGSYGFGFERVNKQHRMVIATSTSTSTATAQGNHSHSRPADVTQQPNHLQVVRCDVGDSLQRVVQEELQRDVKC